MESHSQYSEAEPHSAVTSPTRNMHRPPDAFDNLQQTQTLIQKQINTWAQLNKTFHKKQEQSFLMTFNEIMERMAAELAEAQQKYENIDLEIKKDQRCQRLEKEVHFFREQCLVLRSQVDSLKEQIASLKFQNQGLKEESFVLKRKLNKRAEAFAMDKTVFTNTAVNSTAAKSFYLTEKPKVDEEDLALQGLIYNLKSHDPKDGINLLKTFIRNEVRNTEKTQAKRVTKSTSLAKQTLLYPNLMETTELPPAKNQFLSLWQDCIKEFKINRKLGRLIPKESKFKLLQSFLSSQKFIELLRRKIFGQKCCTNWNCLGNLQSNPNHQEFSVSSPPKRSIQTADKVFRNSRYNRRTMGSNKKKIYHLDNHSVWS